jgi:Tfp pilus assembly protein PilX
MNRWRKLVGDERGVAMVMAMMVLLILTGLVLAFLSVSAFEPQISRNHLDSVRTRHIAEAGIEAGFNQLATADWTAALAGATVAAPWVTVAGLNNATLAGLGAQFGTFTVTVRNDFQAAPTSDTILTGQATVDAGSAATDMNGIIIMRSTATLNGASKTIEVVMKRLALPPFAGAVNIPGNQADTFLNNDTTNWEMDGRTYSCAASCDNLANWTAAGGTPAKYGIATKAGTQTNNGIRFEDGAENAANTATKRGNIKGKNEDLSITALATGLSAIQAVGATPVDCVGCADAATPGLDPTKMATFLTQLAAFPGTTVLQSTQACPMVLTGGSNPGGNLNWPNGPLTNAPTLTNGCSVNKTLDLGSRTDPKLVYVRGDQDPTSLFTGLKVTAGSGIKGAGILVIEDGDFKNYGALEWDGIVIVNGAFVSSAFMNGSNTRIRGAMSALETQPGEAAGFFDYFMEGAINAYSTRFSQQNLDMVQQMRSLVSLSSWREI